MSGPVLVNAYVTVDLPVWRWGWEGLLMILKMPGANAKRQKYKGESAETGQPR